MTYDLRIVNLLHGCLERVMNSEKCHSVELYSPNSQRGDNFNTLILSFGETTPVVKESDMVYRDSNGTLVKCDTSR